MFFCIGELITPGRLGRKKIYFDSSMLKHKDLASQISSLNISLKKKCSKAAVLYHQSEIGWQLCTYFYLSAHAGGCSVGAPAAITPCRSTTELLHIYATLMLWEVRKNYVYSGNKMYTKNSIVSFFVGLGTNWN